MNLEQTRGTWAPLADTARLTGGKDAYVLSPTKGGKMGGGIELLGDGSEGLSPVASRIVTFAGFRTTPWPQKPSKPQQNRI